MPNQIRFIFENPSITFPISTLEIMYRNRIIPIIGRSLDFFIKTFYENEIIWLKMVINLCGNGFKVLIPIKNMTFEIISLDVEGKAFAIDTNGRKVYHMPNYREGFRQAVEVDYFPMNLQGFLLPADLYHDKAFDNLDDARRFVCRLSIGENIRNTEEHLKNDKVNGRLRESKERILNLYKEELERYAVAKG